MRTSIPSLAVLSVLLFLPLAARASPGDGDEAKPYAFDLENVPFESVLGRAKATKRLVFLDFYLPG